MRGNAASAGPERVSQRDYEVDSVYGCWLHLGALNSNGYPIAWTNGKPVSVHREAWVAEHGPIPKGMELEHRCRRRRCRRPAHLMLVTRSQNERLKLWRNRVRVARCERGHDMFVHGIRTPEGGRLCKLCAPVER